MSRSMHILNAGSIANGETDILNRYMERKIFRLPIFIRTELTTLLTIMCKNIPSLTELTLRYY